MSTSQKELSPTKSKSNEVNEQELREAIMDRLALIPKFDPMQVHLKLKGGVVELWGRTPSEEVAREIETACAETPGVSEVIRCFQVGFTPAPECDEDAPNNPPRKPHDDEIQKESERRETVRTLNTDEFADEGWDTSAKGGY